MASSVPPRVIVHGPVPPLHAGSLNGIAKLIVIGSLTHLALASSIAARRVQMWLPGAVSQLPSGVKSGSSPGSLTVYVVGARSTMTPVVPALLYVLSSSVSDAVMV